MRLGFWCSSKTSYTSYFPSSSRLQSMSSAKNRNIFTSRSSIDSCWLFRHSHLLVGPFSNYLSPSCTIFWTKCLDFLAIIQQLNFGVRTSNYYENFPSQVNKMNNFCGHVCNKKLIELFVGVPK